MSIKAKQVAGVTTLVVVVVVVMSAWHMVTVTRLRLQEAQSVAQVLADSMFQRVFDVVNAGPRDPYQAIQQDGGLRTILNSGIGSAPAIRYVLYATVVGPDGRAVAHSIARRRGQRRSSTSRIFPTLVEGGTIEQLKAVYKRTALRDPGADPGGRQAVRRDPGRRLDAAGRRTSCARCSRARRRRRSSRWSCRRSSRRCSRSGCCGRST